MTKISTDPPAFRVRAAQPEEAGAFYAQTPEQYAQMGAIGCVRMDFGKRGTEFWHTWHPRGREELNSPKFKAELQQVVDKLRETVLKDLSSMQRFCCENGGDIPGGWSQNYGYVAETEQYEYCLRCNPVPGDYQAYLSCYDLNEQKINHAYQPLVGRVHFINGDARQFTDATEYLDCIREELPHEATTGFQFRTITQDPAIRKAVDDIVFDLYGEENPCSEEDYGYNVSVVDLRNPIRSDGNNLMTLVNRYMDVAREHPDNLAARANAEKYAKILAKTIVNPGGDEQDRGQNSYFYDAAEGVLATVIMTLSEFIPPDSAGHDKRHIMSVFKLVKELMAPMGKKNGFQVLIDSLPDTHKAGWMATAATSSSEQGMASVLLLRYQPFTRDTDEPDCFQPRTSSQA